MRGRWWLLEWFCEQERILTDDELFAALRRQVWSEAAGTMQAYTASRRRRAVNRRVRRMLTKFRRG